MTIVITSWTSRTAPNRTAHAQMTQVIQSYTYISNIFHLNKVYTATYYIIMNCIAKYVTVTGTGSQTCNGGTYRESKDCCTSSNQCSEGQGDCDGDYECRGDLVCGGTNNCGQEFYAGAECCINKGG